jgi:hypothetical protein
MKVAFRALTEFSLEKDAAKYIKQVYWSWIKFDSLKESFIGIWQGLWKAMALCGGAELWMVSHLCFEKCNSEHNF